MTESFAQMFEESLASQRIRPGQILTGRVIEVGPDVVVVSAGLKSEAVIPVQQFKNERGEVEVSVGDDVEVALDSVEDGSGETRLSREKAKRARTWERLETAFEKQEVVKGLINGRVKGGFTVEIEFVRAFLPGSLVDVRPVRDPSYLEGKVHEFKIIKLDQKRNNVVVSRRAVVEQEYSAERSELLDKLQEGAVVKGVVKNLTDYGAFVEIEDGVEGLVHVSEMDWTNKNVNPSKVVQTGEEVEVMVLDVDEERRRISLGLKQCKSNPWKEFAENFNRGDKVSGQVKSITDFGVFIGLSGNIDGLVHLSDISWDIPGEEAVRSYQKGQLIEAMVLSIDPERERISLGIKQLAKDPFSGYVAEHPRGSIVTGTVTEVDQRGALIDLGHGVEGQLRATELGRDRVDDARTVLKVGDTVEAKFVGVDRKTRSITLSIKAKEIHEEAEAVQSYRTESGGGSSGTSLGDLLKEQIGNDRD